MNGTDQALLKDITEECEAGPMTGEQKIFCIFWDIRQAPC